MNLSDLERSFEAGATVDVEAIIGAGLANGAGDVLVKILAKGELTKNLSVTAHKFSGAAKAAIEKAGGSCTELAAPAPNEAKAEEAAPAEEAEAAEDNSGKESAE